MIFFSLSVALWIVLPKTANIIYLRLGLYEIIRRSTLERGDSLVDIPNNPPFAEEYFIAIRVDYVK